MVDDGPLRVEISASAAAPSIDVQRVAGFLAFAAEQHAASGEVAVWVCSDAEIADLHLRFMDVPGATDVISFPGDPPGSPGAHLGDVAISFETAARQGAEVGNRVGREIAYLALHGLLHLLGYDDLDPSGRARMIARQDELLDEFELSYPGDWD